VTGEGKKDTEPWIEQKHVEYAYAYDKGGKLASKLGVSGIPHAFLINAQGKIVWDGHPSELSDETIKSAVAGALPTPLFDLPASASALKTALQKHNYAAALAEATKVPSGDGDSDLSKIVQGIVTGRVQTLASALKEGNFLGAQDLATALKKELEGLPELPEADKALAEIKANKEADKIIAAQKKVHQIGDQKLGKKAEFEKALADLKKISKDFAGTYAAKEADAVTTQVENKRAAK
jgi:hypothetical protein